MMYGFLGKVGPKNSRTSNEPIQNFDGKGLLKKKHAKNIRSVLKRTRFHLKSAAFKSPNQSQHATKKRAKQIFHVL